MPNDPKENQIYDEMAADFIQATAWRTGQKTTVVDRMFAELAQLRRSFQPIEIGVPGTIADCKKFIAGSWPMTAETIAGQFRAETYFKMLVFED